VVQGSLKLTPERRKWSPAQVFRVFDSVACRILAYCSDILVVQVKADSSSKLEFQSDMFSLCTGNEEFVAVSVLTGHQPKTHSIIKVKMASPTTTHKVRNMQLG
jgi:hypothetical protein